MVLAHCLSPCSKPLAAGCLGYLKWNLIVACQPEPLLLCLTAQCECVRTSSLQGKLHWSQESCTKNKSSPSPGFFFRGESSADASRHRSHCNWQQSFEILRPDYSVLPCSRTSKILWCFLTHDIPLQGEILLSTGITSAYSCGENFRNMSLIKYDFPDIANSVGNEFWDIHMHLS